MNIWIRKSIELANSGDYLDQLYQVYPVEIMGEREIPENAERRIRIAHSEKDAPTLLIFLLELEKFPIDHPFVSIFRRNPDMIRRNPQMVEKIGRILLNMNADELIARCRQPKKANRQIGTMFKKWLPQLSYIILPERGFDTHNSGIVLLGGSDEELRAYANRYLDCGLERGLDLLAKINGKKYIAGEAKYFGAMGGKQTTSFEEAMKFLHTPQGNATRIAVLDGVVWLRSADRMHRKIRNVEAIAMSALLLRDFLESLRNGD